MDLKITSNLKVFELIAGKEIVESCSVISSQAPDSR
jgi:hypothetical protein